jgi:hypothetical protein
MRDILGLVAIFVVAVLLVIEHTVGFGNLQEYSAQEACGRVIKLVQLEVSKPQEYHLYVADRKLRELLKNKSFIEGFEEGAKSNTSIRLKLAKAENVKMRENRHLTSGQFAQVMAITGEYIHEPTKAPLDMRASIAFASMAGFPIDISFAYQRPSQPWTIVLDAGSNNDTLLVGGYGEDLENPLFIEEIPLNGLLEKLAY